MAALPIFVRFAKDKIFTMNEGFFNEAPKKEEIIAGFLELEEAKLQDEQENELPGKWQVMEWDGEKGLVKVREVLEEEGKEAEERWVKPEQLKKINPEKSPSEKTDDPDART